MASHDPIETIIKLNGKDDHETCVACSIYNFFYKFCPNLSSGGIHKDRAAAKQSLLLLPRPLPSDRTVPVLWQNLESNV